MRRIIGTAIAVASIALAGCASGGGGYSYPPSGVPAACYDAAGPVSIYHNGSSYVGNAWTYAMAGCMGPASGTETVVAAIDNPTAVSACTALNPGYSAAIPLNPPYTTAPADAYRCA